MSPYPAVAIIGAGVLGRRIAFMYASHGTPIRIYDTSHESLDSAKNFITSAFRNGAYSEGQLGNQHADVTYHPDGLKAVVSGVWMVIEALPEKLPLKIDIIGKLDGLTDV